MAAPGIRCGMTGQRGQTTCRHRVKLGRKDPQVSRDGKGWRMPRSMKPTRARMPAMLTLWEALS
jgi:hypothetical protein